MWYGYRAQPRSAQPRGHENAKEGKDETGVIPIRPVRTLDVGIISRFRPFVLSWPVCSAGTISKLCRTVNRVAESHYAEFHGIRALSAIDALGIAAANTMVREMRKLLHDGVDINGIAQYSKSTALATAAGYGLIRSVRFLLDNGADINQPGAFDMTPLMHACSCGKAKGSHVALRLLGAGAGVAFIRKSDDMTALKFAATRCEPEVIQALIDHGAEVDGPRGTDQTALMLAARSNNVPAIDVLIRNGADPKLECGLRWAQGKTAAWLAQNEGCMEAYEYLREL